MVPNPLSVELGQPSRNNHRRGGTTYWPAPLTIIGIGGVITTHRFSITTWIESRNGKFSLTVDLMVVPRLLGDQPSITLRKESIRVPDGIELADPTFDKRQPVEILLGSRVFFQIMGPRCMNLCSRNPVVDATLHFRIGAKR